MNYEIGQAVRRNDIGANCFGQDGNVVEIDEAAGRVRVMWLYRDGSNDRRTWLAPERIIAAELLNDAAVVARKETINAAFTRRTAKVATVAKPKPVEVPFTRARFTVELNSNGTIFDSNIVDNTTNQKMLPEDKYFHTAMAIATRLNRSKQPEKMLGRILATGDIDA